MFRLVIIKSLIDLIKAQTYLEIGVCEGEIFYKVNAPFKIAVDPHFLFTLKRRARNLLRSNCLFFEITSDDFFSAKHKLLKKHPVDIAFVDGLHTYQQCLIDIQNCLNYLSDNGYIIVHDCNPPSKNYAVQALNSETEARQTNAGTIGWTGDVWKAIAYLRSTRDDLKVFTIDSDWGVAVITKGKAESTLAYTADEIDNMTYDDLAKSRYELLNLKPSHYFFDYLNEVSVKK